MRTITCFCDLQQRAACWT